MSSLDEAQKNADISVRKDPNATKRVGMSVRRVLIVSIPPQIRFNNAFQQNQAYQAASIYEFCRGIMYNWFPSNNFTRSPVAGSLTINGNSVGNTEFIVVSGQSVTAANLNTWFTTTKDTASSMVFVKGNLSIDNDVVFSPPVRKLFTVVYVSGDLTFGNANSAISMSQRGANHSGTGDSGGSTAEVSIAVGPSTSIRANGADGAAANTTEQTANAGTNGSTSQSGLQAGGGGGGWWDYYTAP
jgi:hypothetical protein